MEPIDLQATYLTFDEAARYIKASPSHLRDLVQAAEIAADPTRRAVPKRLLQHLGEGFPRPVGRPRMRRLVRSELDEWMRQRRASA